MVVAILVITGGGDRGIKKEGLSGLMAILTTA